MQKNVNTDVEKYIQLMQKHINTDVKKYKHLGRKI